MANIVWNLPGVLRGRETLESVLSGGCLTQESQGRQPVSALIECFQVAAIPMDQQVSSAAVTQQPMVQVQSMPPFCR